MRRRWLAVVVVLAVALAGCRTGVRDEDGWEKVLDRGYSCAELRDVAEDLPSSVDRGRVDEDLRKAGCQPLGADQDAGR